MKLRHRPTTVCVLLPSALLLSALLAAPALGAGLTYRLTVKAGKHDRLNTPVCVLLQEAQQQANLDPKMLAEARSVRLTDAAGNELPAQLTPPGLLHASLDRPGVVARELHFILPSLKKGESLELTAVLSSDPPPPPRFTWKNEPGQYAELICGTRPVVRYMCKTLDPDNLEETYKVYHHLYDPAGKRLVTKGPGGKYPHHRGLFFGYCNVTHGDGQKANTWSGHNTPQTHGGILAEEAGPVMARHLAAVEWRANQKDVYLNEKRELTVYNVPGGTLIGFASRLATAGGKVTLDGNAPHAGFHFRADQEVAAETEKLTYYLRPDGKGELGQARASAQDVPWDAISFVLGEDRYTVLYLDKPDNPKPVEYNERTYGRFGSFFKYELDEGKDLEVDYRIWLQDGEMTVEEAAALSIDFVEPVEVRVE
jgi:hypothetical protein